MSGHAASRRRFLETASVGGATMLSASWGLLAGLPPVSADEAAMPADLVQLDDHIEPLVQLIEETPRERLLEEVAARVRRGRSYREVLAALLLAGVRNVQPRPAVGFKFHCVLWSMRAIFPACRAPTKIAGCPFSGPWIISNPRKRTKCVVAAGG